MTIKIFTYLNLIFTVIFTSSIYSQSLRGLVNDGVDNYEESKFAEAEVNFKKGIEKDVESFEPRFNLGDAIYKQGRFEEALEEFKNTLPLAKDDNGKANIFYNIGNTFLKNKKLQESIAAYKEALKLNPNDMDSKYNLSFALKQMQNQQNQQNQNNQDQNQDKQDQNKEDQQDQNQQENQDQNKEQQQEEQQNKQQPQPKDPKEEISKDEAQRILDALKNNEAELQKKMRQKKAKKSKVEKDW